MIRADHRPAQQDRRLRKPRGAAFAGARRSVGLEGVPERKAGGAAFVGGRRSVGPEGVPER
jgi:hypothetical protein